MRFGNTTNQDINRHHTRFFRFHVLLTNVPGSKKVLGRKVPHQDHRVQQRGGENYGSCWCGGAGSQTTGWKMKCTSYFTSDLTALSSSSEDTENDMIHIVTDDYGLSQPVCSRICEHQKAYNLRCG